MAVYYQFPNVSNCLDEIFEGAVIDGDNGTCPNFWREQIKDAKWDDRKRYKKVFASKQNIQSLINRYTKRCATERR